MSYNKIDGLESKWATFENRIRPFIDPTEYHLADIQKLMTAKSVIDLGVHAIYAHTKYLHKLSFQLQNKHDDESISAFIDLLMARNNTPLKIRHHKRSNGFCRFDFTLDRMEGRPYGFDSIQEFNPANAQEFNGLVKDMNELDSLAHGISFGSLPLVEDKVLAAMLKFEDTRCFLVRDKNNKVVAYSYGILLRNIPANNTTVNVFKVVNLVKHPDFYDPNIKIGEALRHFGVGFMNKWPECHFVSYQHDLTHKFHTAILENEEVRLEDEKYQSKSEIEYEFSLYRRHRLVKTKHHELPFPEIKDIDSAFIDALWKAADSVSDFVLGGISLYGRIFYKQWTNSLIERPAAHRIEEPVSLVQQTCDKAILKNILLSTNWNQQGSTWFFGDCIPNTIIKIRQHLVNDDYEFSSLKHCVADSGWVLGRSKLTAYLYFAITQSSSPSAVVNLLIENENTPQEWIKLIDEERQRAFRHNEMVASI